MIKNKIYIRTHGGIGNQLFQILYALIFSEEKNCNEINVYHDTRYKHRFSLAEEIYNIEGVKKCNNRNKYILKSRVVKLIEKLGNYHSHVKIGSDFYLDGYFQNISIYKNYSNKNINSNIEKIRIKILKELKCEQQDLHHLRLRDFFNNETQEIKFAKKELNKLSEGAVLITDNDEILTREELLKIIYDKKIVHIETKNYDSIEILRLIARYQEIYSNNSTVAFWGSILGKKSLNITDKNLKKLYSKFNGAD